MITAGVVTAAAAAAAAGAGAAALQVPCGKARSMMEAAVAPAGAVA